MKKKLLLITLLCLVVIPFKVKADTYNKLDFREALKDEEIEEKFTNYKPNDDAITIYLFRGKGCGFCRAYLEFMNSITDEYGKYFKMETYEVWNDVNNNTLMNQVSTYMGEAASGVPYIVIGDQVFAGYNETYSEAIKDAIETLYNTKKNKRYDVFKEMKKNPSKESGISFDNALIWNFVFVFVASLIIISYINLKFKELSLKIEELSLKNNQVIKKDNKK